MTAEQSSSGSSQPSFNLIDEPWVPVRGLDGTEREVSLREAIRSAHDLRDVTGELPTMRFAILRLILSVMYRVLDREPAEDPVEDWGELWARPTLPEQAFDRYFDEWRHRFDLVDPEQPFLQSPELRTAKDEWKSLSLIVADVDPDHALFTMRSELESLSFAQAARWLIHAHAYDYSGIKSGAVGDPRVKGGKGFPMGLGWCGWLGGIALGGGNLKETLLLNLIRNRTALSPDDLPIWERPVLRAAPRPDAEIGSIGPLALMSWPQRRVRLQVRAGRVSGVLVTNGDEVPYTVQWDTELMSGWRFSEPQSAKAKQARYMPRKFEAGRAIWRGLATLLPASEGVLLEASAQKKWNVREAARPAAVVDWLRELVREEELPADYLVEVSAVSMDYGTQNASFAEVVSDRLSFAAALAGVAGDRSLLEVAQTAVVRAEGSVGALSRCARDVDQAAGGDGESARREAAADAYALLDLRFREWLMGLRPDRDAMGALSDWTEFVRSAMRRCVEAIAEAAAPSAWSGRVDSSSGRVLSVASAMFWFEQSLLQALGAPPGKKVGAEQEVDAGSGADGAGATAEKGDPQ